MRSAHEAFAGPVTALAPGDHVSWFVRSPAEHRDVMTAFVRTGLDRGGRILYLADHLPIDVVGRHLRDAGLDVDQLRAVGTLRLVPPEEGYLRDGYFSPERSLALLRKQAAAAVEDGFDGLWITGEIGWGLRGLPGADRLVEYEAMVEAFFASSTTSVALCQYDASAVVPVGWVRDTHNAELRGEAGMARTPRASRLVTIPTDRGVRLAGEVDAATWDRLDGALREAVGRTVTGSDLFLDVGGVTFIDAGGLGRILGASGQVPEGSRLVLRNPSPLLTRLLSVLGADSRPNLAIQEVRDGAA